MRPLAPSAALDCDATARARGREALTRRMLGLTVAGLLLITLTCALLCRYIVSYL